MEYSFRSLNIQEIKVVYEQEMSQHFPKEELKPFWKIQKLYEEGRYLGIVMETKTDLLAYAMIITDPHSQLGLLDYLASNHHFRGRGYGSQFIQYLRHELILKGLIIEVEHPIISDSEKEREMKERRIDFYLRNGAVKAPYAWYHYDVLFKLLYLPCQLHTDYIDVGEAILEIARLSSIEIKVVSRSKLLPSQDA